MPISLMVLPAENGEAWHRNCNVRAKGNFPIYICLQSKSVNDLYAAECHERCENRNKKLNEAARDVGSWGDRMQRRE